MENWGLITYRLTSLLYNPKQSSDGNKQWVATVVAHELAHQVGCLATFNAAIGWVHTRALSRLKADFSLTLRKSGVWTSKSKQCPIWLSMAKFKSTKSATSQKKRWVMADLERQAWEYAERIQDARETDVWCQTKSPDYLAAFTKAKTKVNTARRRIIFLLCRIFAHILKLSREKVCFTISTQMSASTVYTQAKATNYLISSVKLSSEKLHVISSVDLS